MRLSMMPTAKKKMAGMGMFMKHAEGSPKGPGSPRGGAMVGAGGVGGAITGAAGHGPPPALQPAPQLIASRQAIVEAAKLPLPKSGRYAPMSQPYPPLTHHNSMRRTRPASDNGRENAGQNHDPMWEESTVASMFEDTESRAASDRYHSGHHVRHHSETPIPRSGQYERSIPTMPFVFSDNGVLQVLEVPQGPSATTLNTSVQSGIINDPQPDQLDDPYQDDHHYGGTPPKHPTLKRTKLPHREAREIKRDSFAERTGGYAQGSGNMESAPDPLTENGNKGIRAPEMEEKPRLLEPRHLEHKRSTIFHDLTPVMDEPTWNTNATVDEQTRQFSPESDKAAAQRTPRASRQPPVVQPNLTPEAPLVRTNSRREKPLTKKRPLSLDYDDHQLHKMDYSVLRGEAFDFDPRTMALQAAAAAVDAPSGDTLEDQLRHYRTRDGVDQHMFFTRIPVSDWEACGDWFLEQFGAVVQRMREARRAKREAVRQLEEEISAREESVRAKIDGIKHTLGELEEEGKNMMEGRDVEL